MSIHKNHLKKQKYGAETVQQTFKISKISWYIVYIMDVKLGVFRQYQNTKAILIKKNRGHGDTIILRNF